MTLLEMKQNWEATLTSTQETLAQAIKTVNVAEREMAREEERFRQEIRDKLDRLR